MELKECILNSSDGLASLASQPTFFHEYEAEQRYIMDRCCGDEDLVKACISVVMGDSFSVRQLEIHVRTTVGNSSSSCGELISNCCLMTTVRGHAASNSSITMFHCRNRHIPVLQSKARY